MTARAFDLGPMPARRRLLTVDERLVHAPPERMFDLTRAVERWPAHLGHYRSVGMRDRRPDGGGIVTMAAERPFGPIRWPVWWEAEMQVVRAAGRPPAIRFRHIAGVTRGMDVEWSFTPLPEPLAPTPAPVATFVRIVHMWDGPAWPLIGGMAATGVIGPVFVHGIASRTLAGLAAVAERACLSGTPDRDTTLTNSQSDNLGVQG
jgi:ribosome-associated toxin RatA of RatAB toxin-antitoxin module